MAGGARAGGPAGRARVRFFLVHHHVAYELALTALASAWVVLGLLLRGAGDDETRRLLSLSGVIGIVFVADWVVRARSAGDRRGWVRRHWGIPVLALVGVLPVEPVVQVARFLLAFLGLRRVLAGLGGIFVRFPLLDELVAAALSVVAAGGVLVYELEEGANERITSVWDGLWWSLVTVTTVGYGDIAPVTAGGRAVAAILMVIGVALFAVLTATVGKHLAEERRGGRGDAALRLRRIGAALERHEAGELDAAAFADEVRRHAGGGRS